MTQIKPKPDEVFTWAQIMDDMDLPDSPNLIFFYKDIEGVIQDSHYTIMDLQRQHPELMEIKWRYSYTTNEQIPIFHLMSHPDELVKSLILEPMIKKFGRPEGDYWWAVPKAFPREQD